MAAKTTFYFHSKGDEDQICYNEKHFQEYMKECGITEMYVYPAKRMYGQDFFYCSKFNDIGEKGESCGKDCDKYTPRNGKSGICKYNKPIYEPAEIPIVLKRN